MRNTHKSGSSRPVYARLTACNAVYYLLLADADGAQAILDIKNVDTNFYSRAHIMYANSNCTNQYLNALRALNPHRIYSSPSIVTMLLRFERILATIRMGACVYLAGTENLIGQAQQIATAAGIEPQSIQTELRGAQRYRVQCAHCKSIMNNINTRLVKCASCGLQLQVRDHYSRRYAAYQGVCMNAEDTTLCNTKGFDC